jgi:GNAT superfamily N-acetyltransferase
MSRNLYTIAVVAPAVGRELQRLRRASPDDWWQGAGERRLADETAADTPRVAFYRVVLDGWDHGLLYLAAAATGRGSPLFRSICKQAEDRGLTVIEASLRLPMVKAPRHRKGILNAYAITALAAALNDASGFAASTGCPIVILHRTLCVVFDDGEFRRDGTKPQR